MRTVNDVPVQTRVNPDAKWRLVINEAKKSVTWASRAAAYVRASGNTKDFVDYARWCRAAAGYPDLIGNTPAELGAYFVACSETAEALRAEGKATGYPPFNTFAIVRHVDGSMRPTE